MDKKQQIPGLKQQSFSTSVSFPTSTSVRQAMLQEIGYRDVAFVQIIREIRKKILEIGRVADMDYESILVEGSGVNAVEAVISTGTPPDGKWLVIQNGYLGAQIAKIVDVLGIRKTLLKFPEDSPPDLEVVYKTLKDDPLITHVAIVHNEITTGLINPIKEIGEIVKRFKKIYFVDARSSFGAVNMNLEDLKIHWLASTADQSIEGVPGIAFAVAQKSVLMASQGNARSYSLDIFDQWNEFEKYGQFRFLPPVNSVLAFRQALIELEEEGGVPGREARYLKNSQTLIEGMRDLSFTELLAPEFRVHSFVPFNYPEHPKFNFARFYQEIYEHGYLIYPGMTGNVSYFKVPVCGRVHENDVFDMLKAIKEAMAKMPAKN